MCPPDALVDNRKYEGYIKSHHNMLLKDINELAVEAHLFLLSKIVQGRSSS